jgi:hypothetical protein
MPHADKARGQNMQQKALDKSVSLKLRYLHAVALLTVAKGESNLIPYSQNIQTHCFHKTYRLALNSAKT